MTEKDDHHRDDGVVVHLGFIEPVEQESVNDSNHVRPSDWIGHKSPQYDMWDGGQIGGRPSFLDPQNLPNKPISCLLCGDVMKFVLQIYAPIDDYEDRAFHRSLYVFCCPNNNHHCNNNNTNNDATVGTIRVLRVQLPQENPYFPYESSSNSSVAADWDAHLPSTYNIQLCRVCGMRAPFKCPLQGCYFCSKKHQKEYKKYVFNVMAAQCSGNETNKADATHEPEKGNEANGPSNSLKAATTTTTSSSVNPVCSSLPSVYPFAALVIGEDEEHHDDDDDPDNDKKKSRETLFDYNSDDEEEELDRNLEQDDLNRMTGRKSTVEIQHDVTAHFQRKCQANPWQVLRYARTWSTTTRSGEQDDGDGDSSKGESDGDSNHPLWIRADYQPKDIPPCPYCHAPRKFEFQLMPQLLHGLERLQKQQRRHQEASLVHAVDASIKSAAGADSCENDREKNGHPCSAALQEQEANKYRQIMGAVQQAEDLIQQAPPEQIPPSLVEAKEAAVERLRQERFGGTIDWGVVAIYTCTKSCNGGEPADGVVVLDPALGTYREEFAWRQPSLDAP